MSREFPKTPRFSWKLKAFRYNKVQALEGQAMEVPGKDP